MRRRSRRGGFTLTELIVAMSLAAIVIVGMNNLLLPLIRSQVAAARSATAQAGLTGALGAAEKALRRATLVTSPALAGLPADRLEGCVNALPQGAGLPPVPLDPGRPMTWFALCSWNGELFYHEGAGCPPRYACGQAALAEFGGGTSRSASAAFTRPSNASAAVDIALSLTSGSSTASAQSAVAFAAAAGTNQ